MESLLRKIRTPFRYTYKNVTLLIVLINILVYFLYNFTNLISVSQNFFSINVVGFVYNRFFWQPITYMFLHSNLSHLFFNMLGLLFFGIQVEKALGSKEFALMYFLIGIFSGLFSLLVYYLLGIYSISIDAYPTSFFYSLIGASGVVYGILFAYATIFPRSRIYIYFFIPVPAPLLVLIYAIIEFFSQFLSSSNVSHQTHLAGFGIAFLYFFIRMGVNPIKIWKDTFRR